MLLVKSGHHDYSYEVNNDKRNEGIPHERIVPRYSMMDAAGRVYCAHNCHCMLNKFPACEHSIGEAKR